MRHGHACALEGPPDADSRVLVSIGGRLFTRDEKLNDLIRFASRAGIDY